MMTRRERRRGGWPRICRIVLLMAFSGLSAGVASAQTIERRVDDAVERLDQARAEHLDIISPRNFERAVQKLGEARERLVAGGTIDEVERRLEDGHAELDRAESLADAGAILLGEALAARQDALTVNAPRYAEDDWVRAERMARDAGRRIESNDRDGAHERADRAVSDYRSAELNAIRADLLGRAQDLRAAALEAKADRWAPLTLTRADSLLTAAEVILAEDRSRTTDARDLAGESAKEYRHAARLALVADSVDRNRLSLEAVALRAEAQVRRVAEALRYDPDFTDDIEPVVDEALLAVGSLYEEMTSLRSDFEARGREIRRLEGRVDSVDARLAEIEQREAAVSAELRERQRRERRLREVQAVLTADEGEALLGEDRLILRLKGLTFESGSAQIRPENFSLLTKVQRIIREFPASNITVEGHTDSRGNEALNQALSRRRAIAVRESILSNMAISADRVSAVGYGESRPVAPNDTEAGRARNRRIEITLSLGDD
jgi:outer membrane protein OmpA-like peptidoglycan-associated protein